MCLKTDKRKSPEIIKEELLLSLLVNADENELRINEALRNANQLNEAIQIIKNYELLFFKKQKNKKMFRINQMKEFRSLKNTNFFRNEKNKRMFGMLGM